MTPRLYQIRVLEQIWSALHMQQNSLIVAPCAAGKTILFSLLIRRLLRENQAFRALILVDREILVTQSRDKLATVAPELVDDIGIICARVAADKDGSRRVTIASRQSLAKNLQSFAPVQLCICDEAHLIAVPMEDDTEPPDQWNKIISTLREYNPNMRLVGCTASPYRLGMGYIYGDRNKPGAVPHWPTITARITTAELIAEGFLSRLVGRVAVDAEMAHDLASVQIIGGEFNLSQMADVMLKEIHVKSCVDAWNRYARDRKKTLVFCTTIDHAEAVAKAFDDAGIPAQAIHSKLSKLEALARMENMEHGRHKVYTSVAKLTTGLDCVDIDCVLVARPTKSTALHIQMLGRGMRVAEGKTDCLLLDLVDNTHQFGTDLDNPQIEVPKGGGGGDAPTKVCHGSNADGTVCGAVLHAALRFCPQCGYKFPVVEAVAGVVGEMKEVAFNATTERLELSAVYYGVHENRDTGRKCLRVTYCSGGHFGVQKVSEFICFPDHYSGYAVQKAKAWWEERSNNDFPETVEDAYFDSDELITPTAITVRQEGKYRRVVGYEFPKDDDYEDIPTGPDPEKSFVGLLPYYDSDEVPF